MTDYQRPTKAEEEFLKLAYRRFYEIEDIVFADDFLSKDSELRFNLIKDGFAIYSEILNYEPIKWELEKMKTKRPPMESEISKDLFRFVRNLIFHFPFFSNWNEVFITKQLVNWHKPGQSIDKFIEKYRGTPAVKYRLWESREQRMTYVTINFPVDYNEEKKIFLKDIINETEGVKFSFKKIFFSSL